jgi:hypothetical protein
MQKARTVLDGLDSLFPEYLHIVLSPFDGRSYHDLESTGFRVRVSLHGEVPFRE